MKVTYNWLKDFVDIKIEPKVLADKLTMAGLEVKSIEKKNGDSVFEIEITSNRPDWLSIAGIAREVAAITQKKLKLPSVAIAKNKNTNSQLPFSIVIENKNDCPLYTAKIIRDVKVGPSAGWLKRRLESIGCRSVNNIVDITNYVLFEYGQPLHAFDLDKLVSGKNLNIVVRRARKGEKIITIDEQERALNEGILVIAAGAGERLEAIETPVAIAGVMGGKDAEVTEATKNILLEAAVFNPVLVRSGRRDLGLSSDSSYRFERGIDLRGLEKASLRALELIEQLCSGKCVLARNSGFRTAKRKTIVLEAQTIKKILGIDVGLQKTKQILNNLGFVTKAKTKQSLLVVIPSHRQDVNSEVDLIEEIARIYGYEFIPQTLPAVRPALNTGLNEELPLLVKNILLGLGLNEAITHSLTDGESVKYLKPGQDSEVIDILNPLSREQEILRPAIIPSLAACIAYNLNQKQEYVRIFEIAKRFLQKKGSTQEELMLAIGLCGVKSYISEQGLVKEESGILHLKGILETLFERLGIKDYSFATAADPYTFDILLKQQKMGQMIQISKEFLDRLDIKNKNVFMLEMSLERIFSFVELNRHFFPPAKYPGISRDISLVLKEEVSLKKIFDLMHSKGEPFLHEVKVTDYYKGKQIPQGYRGLTISCLYSSAERTLTESEIAPLHSAICVVLNEKFGAQIR